jgi:DNA-binding response OmpR family regulator
MNSIGTIAIVDDDLAVRRLLAKMVRPLGVTITSFESGAAFLQSQSAPDVLLLDVVMPVLDGVETCRRARAHFKDHFFPVLMVTGVPDAAIVSTSLQAGATDVVRKPVAGDELRARVSAALRLKRQADAWRGERDVAREAQVQFESEVLHVGRSTVVGTLSGAVGHELNNLAALVGAGLSVFDVAAAQSPTSELAEVVEDLHGVFGRLKAQASAWSRLAASHRDGRSADIVEGVSRVTALLEALSLTKHVKLMLCLPRVAARVRLSEATLDFLILALLLQAIEACGQRGRILVSAKLAEGQVSLVLLLEGVRLEEGQAWARVTRFVARAHGSTSLHSSPQGMRVEVVLGLET